MDLQTALIGTIIIILCVSPFYLIGRNGKKKRETLLIGLTNLAKQHQQKLDQIDYGSEFSIGATQNKEAIIFYKKTSEKEIALHMDLKTIQSCTINQFKNTVEDHGKRYETIERLELVCKPIVSQKPIIILEFYNAEDGIQLNGELELLNKWHRFINETSDMKHRIKNTPRELVA